MWHLHSDGWVFGHCHHVLLISVVERFHRIVPDLKHVRVLALYLTKAYTSKVQWRHVVVFHSMSNEWRWASTRRASSLLGASHTTTCLCPSTHRASPLLDAMTGRYETCESRIYKKGYKNKRVSENRLDNLQDVVKRAATGLLARGCWESWRGRLGLTDARGTGCWGIRME
jgi:hypothetical protein